MYDYNGNVINEYEYKNGMDFSGNSVVRDSNLYYLVDENNKKISAEYSDIRTEKILKDNKTVNYYVGKKGEFKFLLSPEGKELVSEGAKSINVGNKYVTLEYEDSVKIYDLKNNKIILELNEKLSNIYLKDYYVEVIKDGHTSYYSYTTGKKFYTN